MVNLCNIQINDSLFLICYVLLIFADLIDNFIQFLFSFQQLSSNFS